MTNDSGPLDYVFFRTPGASFLLSVAFLSWSAGFGFGGVAVSSRPFLRPRGRLDILGGSGLFGFAVRHYGWLVVWVVKWDEGVNLE